MSARRDLRNAEQEWRRSGKPERQRSAPRAHVVFNTLENRVLCYIAVAAIIVLCMKIFGFIR